MKADWLQELREVARLAFLATVALVAAFSLPVIVLVAVVLDDVRLDRIAAEAEVARPPAAESREVAE